MADARKPLISGNWKMHLNHFEAIQLIQKLGYELRDADYDAADVSVHPPFTDLRSVQTVLEADRNGDQRERKRRAQHACDDYRDEPRFHPPCPK